ncbi:hypothetical protein ABEB36_005501 [Hypothenemus hampei]|uniref:Amidase domain-containing protein n=1 Tax=Hypothenemus hampei TaxID=57062 RepID=A0ABD1EYF1_HYPHA
MSQTEKLTESTRDKKMDFDEIKTSLNKTNIPKEHYRAQQHLSLCQQTARATVYALMKALNILYVPIFIYRIFQKSKKCSAVIDPILRITAVDLARRIRLKEISCLEVTKTYINRIKEVNPLLNAVIDDRFDEALEDAKKVDALLVSSKDQHAFERDFPLLGVPITIKGSLAVKGLKHSSGSIMRKDYIAEKDADVVALARAAGAIPILVSNVPELCMSWETTNKLIGTTNNPHDSTRTCGGSSGGEASLLASAASLIGVGSDIAGSLRLPAHYCGVWGHKPTPGAVSFDGHYPSCIHRERWESIFTVGPMARYASDMKTLLTVITKPEKRATLNLDKKINIKNIKVYYSDHKNYYWKEPNRYCRGAVRKVVEHLGNTTSFEPQEIDFHLSQHAPDLASFDILCVKDIEDMFDGNGKGAYKELTKYATFNSKHTFMLIICALLRRGVMKCNQSEKLKAKTEEYINKIRKEYEDILGDDGVLVVPSFPIEAPKHGDVLRTAIYAGYLSVFNVLGFPVTNCPVGVTRDGLPIGVQIAAKKNGDNLTLTVAEELENAFGGWIEPRF